MLYKCGRPARITAVGVNFTTVQAARMAVDALEALMRRDLPVRALQSYLSPEGGT